MTISFWLNSDAGVVDDDFIGKTDSINFGFRVGVRTAAVDLCFTPQVGGTIHGRVIGGITEDTWEQWIVVWNQGGVGNAAHLQIYKNGVAQSVTFTGTISDSDAIGNSGAATLKTMKSNAAAFADGALANVMIWAGAAVAFTAAEAAQQSQSRRPIRTDGLVLWAPYDDEAADYSGAGNHGTVTGTTVVAGPPESFGAPYLIL